MRLSLISLNSLDSLNSLNSLKQYRHTDTRQVRKWHLMAFGLRPEPTLRSESRGQTCLLYAEPQGGRPKVNGMRTLAEC